MENASRARRSFLIMSVIALFVGCGSPATSSSTPPLATGPATGTPAATSQATPGQPTATPTAGTSAVSSPSGGASPSASPLSGPAPIAVATIAQEASLVVAWESAGAEPSRPCTADPAIDHDGRLWVIACWDNTFWIFAPDGTFKEAWGEAGSADGQFDFVWGGGDDAMGGVAFAPDGSFYTFEAGNLRVQHFDKNRQFLSAWGSFGRNDGQFAKPTAIGIDSDGNVFVVDASREDIQVFDGDGNLLRTVAQGVSQGGFGYMAVGESGDVFMAGSYRNKRSILHYLADGSLTAVYDLSAVALDHAGMALDGDGHLFIAAFTNDLPSGTLEMDMAGKLVHRWPSTGEMFAYDKAALALDVTTYNWSFARQYALPGD